MKTIIDWFLNLDSIVNITPSSFWWIALFIALPYIIFVLEYFSTEKYKGFWVFVSAVYAVFAMYWCINLGWEMKVNQYQKHANTIDMNVTVDVVQPTDSVFDETDSVTVDIQYSASLDSTQNITDNRVKTVKVPLNVYRRSHTNHYHHYNHH